MNEAAKTCNKCDVSKPLSDFTKLTRNKDGRHGTCRECRGSAEKLRRATKRLDPEYRAADNAKNRERLRAKYAADPEVAREYHRAWRAENRDKVRAAVNKYYYKDHESTKARARDRYAVRPENGRKSSARYRAANPVKIAGSNAARQAAKLNATVDGPVDYAAIYAAHDNCYLCGRTLVNPVHMDHVIPLSRGGAHSIGNLLPAHNRCNLRKHDKLLSELDWYRGPVDLGAVQTTEP